MPASGNLGFQAPSLTPPPGQNVQVETYADEAKANQQQAQMPPVYYGGKTGSIAFMADKVLTGWLAGTKMAQERKAKQMANEVGAAKTGLDYIGQAYRAAVESGDQKKIAETKSALSEAYNDYLNKAEKYAIPEDTGKKTTGQKIKSGLKRFAQGGENPHLDIAKSTLDIMRKTDPTQLYGPSKQEQQQSEVLDMQTKQMKDQQRDQDRWAEIAQKDPSKLTDQDKRFQEYYEYKNFGQTPAQQRLDQTKDQLLTKIAGGQQLSDQERTLAENFGFIKPKVTSTQIRTIQDKNGNPVSQLISIGPDGQVVGTQNLPGKDYIGPNQAQMAGQMINAQMSAMMKWGAKMHPEWDPKTPEGQKALTQWAMRTLYPPTAGTIDWADKNAQMDTMNRALQAVLAKHKKEYKDPNTGAPTTSYDEMGNAVLGNLVSTTDDGRYAYMPSLAPGQKEGGSSWYNPWSWGDKPTEKWSGMTREQLNSQERQFQAELRAELKKQNPKLPDTEIDKMMPPMLTRQQAQGQQMAAPPGETTPRAMQPPPTAKGFPTLETPPAPQGEKWFTVTLPDGTKANRSMSQEYADALQARGVTVTPVGQ